MKKGIVVIFLLLAVVVIISPGLIGKIAEESMDENLEFAATESDVVTIESRGFDRGWFSSEGQHRVELKPGELYDTLLLLGSDSLTGLPALIIDTRIDHGLVPVTSMSREQGSLAPGLGNAVSTLRLEDQDGTTVDLPGVIYSKMGLSGELASNLVLEAGTFEDAGEQVQWGDVDITIGMHPSSSAIEFEGSIAELFFVDAYSEVSVSGITFEGEQQQSGFGFTVGDVSVTVDGVTLPSNFGDTTFGPIEVSESAWLDGDTVSGEGGMAVNDIPMADLGRGNLVVDVSASGLDARAIGNISQVIDNIDSYGSDDQLLVVLEPDLERLLAKGFEVRFEQFDIALQPGTVSATLNVEVEPTDVDDFVMTSLLTAVDAELALSIPAELYDYAVSIDPSVSTAVGLGFLRLNGDVYEMEATFSKGMLEVNGAPMPGLIPGLN